MNTQKPFNPLDKKNLGISVADALLEKQEESLPPSSFKGAGIYAIYYSGDFEPYRKISFKYSKKPAQTPIYVGKAVPAGGRKGGFTLDEDPGDVLFKRLKEHSQSIEQAINLDLNDFFCRYLVVDDIWIPLGESLLIQRFMPLWNIAIDGFGNHDPGKGRYEQVRSLWDVIHPGRQWAEKCQQSSKSVDDVLKMIEKAI